MAPFKSGAFAIAIQKKIPIVPVTFVSNWKILQRTGIWKGSAGPGVAEVIIHQPIITTDLSKADTQQLKKMVEGIINNSLNIEK